MFSVNLRFFRYCPDSHTYDYFFLQLFLFKLHVGFRICKYGTGLKEPDAFFSDGDIHIDGAWMGKYYRILHTELLE